MTADLSLRHAKARGEICMVWYCPATHPQHAIVWKCPAGHRQVNWYCRPCAEEMAVLVARGAVSVCQEPAQGSSAKNGACCGLDRVPVWEVPGYGSMSASMTRYSGRMYSP